MREQLGLINGMNGFFALEFESDPAINSQVCPETAIELHAFIDERHGFLSLDSHACLPQFVGETGFIGRFEQARPEFTMHSDGSRDDIVRDLRHTKILNRRVR